MTTGDYRVEGVGVVHVLVRPNARSVRARWKGSRIHVTVPAHISGAELERIIQGFASHLDDVKPEPLYHPGQVIEMPEFSVEIRVQKHLPDRMLMSFRDNHGYIDVGSDWDFSSHNTMQNISKMLCRIAQRMAPGILLPMAEEIAEKVDKKPLLWTISNGHRILGHCDAKGTIALSYILAYYPMHLREYVICHELAHLTEMNHSARFHVLCDQYCAGREKEWVAQIKAFRPPILR